jgi:predicted membrane channel-forming protein YqfA (hemolysin III family)
MSFDANHSLYMPDVRNQLAARERVEHLAPPLRFVPTVHQIFTPLDRRPAPSTSADTINKNQHHRVQRFHIITHAIAAILFGVFAIVRTQLEWFVRDGIAGFLVGVFPLVMAFVFAASTLYHSTLHYNTGTVVSLWTNYADRTAIYTAASFALLCDISIGAINHNVEAALRWQTWVDAVAMIFVSACFFAVLVVFNDPTQTYQSIGSATKGSLRWYHSDLIHAPTRTMVSVAFITMWMLIVPYVAITMPSPESWWLIASYGVSCSIIVIFFVNDLYGFTSRCMPTVDSTMESSHCVHVCGFTEHGLWHIMSATTIAVTLVAREAVLRAQVQRGV